MSTDRNASTALVEQRRRFRDDYATARTPACLLTEHGRIDDVNDAFCRLLRCDRGDVIGLLISEFADPRDVDLMIVMLDLVLAGTVQRLSFHLRGIDATGEHLDVLVSGDLVTGADSRPVCFLLEMASA